MSLINKLTKTAALATLIALASPKEAEASDISFSAKLGYQIPSEQLTQDFSSGLAYGGEVSWFPMRNFSVDLGASVYNSPGDFLSYTNRGLFTRNSGAHSASSDEISFNEGLTIYGRGKKVVPFLGAGLKQSIFEDNDVSRESGYRESYSERDVNVRDIATGSYFNFGFMIPLDYEAENTNSKIAKTLDASTNFFIEFELRNLSKKFEDFKRDYRGYTLSLGLNF